MPTSKEKLEAVLQQVVDKTAELAALKPLKPADEERLWKKFRLEWNFNSNHIEGNTLSYSETKLLLIFDQTPAEPHTLRELEEMKAHDVAVELIRQWAASPERELTETDIRSLNQTILVRPFWKDAVTPDRQPTRRLITVGEYKKQPNSVRLPNGEIFHYTAPDEVQREMGELMEWYRSEGPSLHPVLTAALLHYRFVRIHPFDDGNGRISRLLLNYHLLRNGLPPIVIKSSDKQNYLFALQKADVGDLDAFCVYVAEQLLWSLDLSIRAAKGESVEEAGDWEKQVELLFRDTETRLKNLKNEKLRYEDKLGSWLKINVPLLLESFRQHFEPFNAFFENANCNVYLKYHNSDVSVPVDVKNNAWQDIAKGIVNRRYEPCLFLSYHFEGFRFGEDFFHPVLDQPSITVKIGDDYLKFENESESWLLFPVSRLSDSNLQPIRRLAEKFKKQIESKLKDANPFF